VADKFNTLQRGVIAGERIKNILEQENEIKNNGVIADVSIKGKIEFKNVSFHYIEGTPVLKNVSFAIEQGKSLAIVGSTGSGKTSLTQLLCRNYEYQQGIISLDNNTIEKYDISFLRKNIGVVLQDVFLFSGSIFDNITLYNPEITLHQVEDAARMIGLHDFIMKLPNGYHQSVMERGNTLSLGQRQLISFLRAVIFNPAVLILDEATSSIESETELLMQNAIPKLLQNRTSIIIAHRLSTIESADKIIVLEKGEIIESGTHHELLAMQNHYFKLYHHQFITKQ
jgi:ATP-binding cassette subfamily B protein